MMFEWLFGNFLAHTHNRYVSQKRALDFGNGMIALNILLIFFGGLKFTIIVSLVLFQFITHTHTYNASSGGGGISIIKFV